MAQGERAGSENRRAQLFHGPDFAAAWEHVLQPWFQRAATEALRARRPFVVIVPNRLRATQLRRHILNAKISLAGVRFITPPRLRELLFRERDFKLPLREHLRLLLSIAAEESAARDETRPNHIPRAIARNPDSLLRVIDDLNAAGWKISEISDEPLRKIVDRFHSLQKNCRFQLISDAERAAKNDAHKSEPKLESVLVTGFNAAHWPQWHLLSAAVAASNSATIHLTDSRDEARTLDETWIGSWEQEFGAAETIPAATQDPCDDSAQFRFAVGRDTREQASAILLLATEFLAQDDHAQIAIFFPCPGALHRLVESDLSVREIPHDDAIGHNAMLVADNAAWTAWLELQENPRIRILLRFLRHCSPAVTQFGGMEFPEVEDQLRRAYSTLLLDNVTVLREHCARRSKPEIAAKISAGIDAIDFLPEKTSFGEFTQRTLTAFEGFDWQDRVALLRGYVGAWCDAIDVEFSRRTYLRWLSDLMTTLDRERDTVGDHPYSHVHLLPYSAAGEEAWTHVIFAGLNEGEWPASTSDSGFLAREDIAKLNARATQSGRQGSGHLCVKEKHSLLLGDSERRAIALRDFQNAMESTSVTVAATAQLFGGTSGARVANPSDFLARIYFDSNRHPLSRPRFEALQRATESWLNKSATDPEKPADDKEIDEMLTAYRARRDVSSPAGKFDFALLKAPHEPLTLRATEWKTALQEPALVWMKHYLGVEANDDEIASWHPAIGNWVHHWLAAIVPSNRPFAQMPPAAEIARMVERAATSFRAEAQSMVKAAGRELPDWWLSGWRNARYLALGLARRLYDLKDWPLAVTEMRIGDNEKIDVATKRSLRIHGRLDLVLAKTAKAAGGPIWIIDYKTGRDAKLGAKADALRKQLIGGSAVQIGLYAFALQQRGYHEVGLTLLTKDAELDAPQTNLAAFMEHADVWSEIARMAETGIFGMKGEIRSAFRATGNYPIAMLAIDSELLELKWELTHPAFAEKPK